jgi:hypothetical protein
LPVALEAGDDDRIEGAAAPDGSRPSQPADCVPRLFPAKRTNAARGCGIVHTGAVQFRGERPPTTADHRPGDSGRLEPHRIVVGREIAGAAPPVPADAEMLTMVFHNLLINRAHAMDGRGRIRVEIGAEGRDC